MSHVPVMLAETLEQLKINPEGVYVDGTFGRGGHSGAILRQLSPRGRLLAFDRDLTAVGSEHAQSLSQDARFSVRHSPFSEMAKLLEAQNLLGAVDGILLDLGVSSPQLDDSGRGFSFMRDGALDMRMDTTAGLSARDWLAAVTEKELVRVLFEYGEERFARKIAKAIIEARAIAPIQSSKQLADLITQAVVRIDPHKHPATRSFQAIRIEINQELEELSKALEQSLRILKPGGRLVVIAFHSLEDRIVKRFIRDEAGAKYDPGRLPIKQADIAKGVLKKIGKAIKPSPDELKQNPRARSAVLRVAEKIKC